MPVFKVGTVIKCNCILSAFPSFPIETVPVDHLHNNLPPPGRICVAHYEVFVVHARCVVVNIQIFLCHIIQVLLYLFFVLGYLKRYPDDQDYKGNEEQGSCNGDANGNACQALTGHFVGVVSGSTAFIFGCTLFRVGF